MDILLNIIRIIAAVFLPIGALYLIILTLTKTRQAQGKIPKENETCIRCGEVKRGDTAKFFFTEALGNPRERTANKKLLPSDTTILGSETHFVCDRCARRHIHSEILQTILMILPYPLYLYVIIPLFAQNGVFANFLIETLLVVLSIAGAIAAFDLYQAIRAAPDILTEARDRVAIDQRKEKLGKGFSYYSRLGKTHLER